MVLSKRERLSIYLMVVVISIYLVYTYGLTPTLRRWELVRQELIIKEARLINEETLLKNKTRLEQDYSRLAPLLGGEEEIPDLLRGFSKMARMSGVRIGRVSQGPKGGESSKEVPLEMGLEGDMNGLAQFLNSLESSAYPLKVNSLRIRPKLDNPIELDIHLLLSIKDLGWEGGQ